jgi:hypothetical protein
MEVSQTQALKNATASVQAWTHRHNQAGALIALPLVVGFVMISVFPSALSDIVLAVAPAMALTTGMLLIPESFLSRRGSLVLANGLLAATWAIALLIVLLRLLG